MRWSHPSHFLSFHNKIPACKADRTNGEAVFELTKRYFHVVQAGCPSRDPHSPLHFWHHTSVWVYWKLPEGWGSHYKHFLCQEQIPIKQCTDIRLSQGTL